MGLERLKDCPLRCQDGVGKGNTFQLQPIEKGNALPVPNRTKTQKQAYIIAKEVVLCLLNLYLPS